MDVRNRVFLDYISELVSDAMERNDIKCSSEYPEG